jgi:hypothetical protein
VNHKIFYVLKIRSCFKPTKQARAFLVGQKSKLRWLHRARFPPNLPNVTLLSPNLLVNKLSSFPFCLSNFSWIRKFLFHPLLLFLSFFFFLNKDVLSLHGDVTCWAWSVGLRQTNTNSWQNCICLLPPPNLLLLNLPFICGASADPFQATQIQIPSQIGF